VNLHQFTPDDIFQNIMVRVNEDSWAMYYAFCVITPEACSSPDGPGQRRAIG